MQIQNGNFWDAKLYNEMAVPQYHVAMNLLETYPFQGTEEVLDIGCGTGNITVHIAEKVKKGKVIGIDISEDMINFAKQTFSGVSNLSFEQKNIIDISYANKFDLITSFNTLHWVKEKETAIEKMFAHLKKDGHLLVTMLRSSFDAEPMNIALTQTVRDQKWYGYFKEFKPPYYLYNVKSKEYKDILMRVGFTIQFFNENCYNLTFATKEDLAAWCESWIPQRLAIPYEKRKAFFLDLVDNYVNNTRQSAQLSYYYYTWEFMALKHAELLVV
ncbi:MAG: class I SAM-dependent methyltransferase [Proteobacteria bacterium]|nr:class I SAM-dependent methyltransferase [Pseudomonadota bacterium]